uniref:Uncharacterized protein n=1 Tax=Panagrolaimus sp. JU765 TaxID=591449 RepID=A0AC34PUY2_9BILA
MSSQLVILATVFAMIVVISNAQPIIFSGTLVEPIALANPQITKRSLANGRWGLRPGKRSGPADQDLDQLSPESLGQQPYRVFVFA